MNYLFPFIKKPQDPQLPVRLNEAAVRLSGKLNRVNPAELAVSDYNKKYLAKYIRKMRQTLQKYVYLLMTALDGTGKRAEDTVLIDYGGGSGLISLLAKEAGVGRVIYNDIFETSITDVKELARVFEIDLDDYICGDIQGVLEYTRRLNLKPDALVSSDVLEHIYDLDMFFGALVHHMPDGFSFAMTTHANPGNPVINYLLKKKQRALELTDRPPEWGHKASDSLRSYRRLRMDIIREGYPSLNETEINMLALRTRGRHRGDIMKCAEEYVRARIMPPMPDHPTNTCDPLTGNRADRLMKPKVYLQILSQAGFQARLLNGYYGHPRPLVRRIIARLLDLGIYLTGRQGYRLASYFIIAGKKSPHTGGV